MSNYGLKIKYIVPISRANAENYRLDYFIEKYPVGSIFYNTKTFLDEFGERSTEYNVLQKDYGETGPDTQVHIIPSDIVSRHFIDITAGPGPGPGPRRLWSRWWGRGGKTNKRRLKKRRSKKIRSKKIRSKKIRSKKSRNK